MRLTRYTDYAMRVLLHLAARDDGLSSIGEIAGLYKISQNHLMKVVQDLGKAGFVRTVRGRGGGVALARPADQISIGQVVRQTEEGFQLVDCDGCVIAPACTLPRVLNEATAAFMAVLDKYSLEDLLDQRHQMRSLFGITDPAALPA
ncbi:Rrf2 family transcriptional regulator [Caulobacter sp. Root1455]|uniref:RrF2 family transcriptional regulator n=1 Tax=unclassified Caulobacter TaxID=2648921 RepID=UPI0006F39DB8|nr:MULTISPECIES: Rrf2 family transcriptional regulator [unclassified Caulobacter]KQY28750.1 Rrf2 family transcriptional regulator [Caulobacter sp. Root487D2Y]KQY98908.1 Rrf2 family transcriptional regulator [Caulobacter sp. Root1455]